VTGQGHALCLNCGAPLHGPFCAACGQRALPPYPTAREMVGDAWEEMSGWDGRFARTLRTLFGRPGAITIETLEGRRARYVKPLRLYLTASVLFFIVAAATPRVGTSTRAKIPGKNDITIDLADPTGAGGLTPEKRQQALEAIERAPAPFRPIFRTIILDPAGFRVRMVAAVPRMLFALVPVFAAILMLFYRRRGFMQHLVFALHIHAVIFLSLAAGDLARVFRSPPAAAAGAVAAVLFIAVYALRALKAVYGGRWAITIAKSAGIAVLYALVMIPAMVAAVAWATLTR